MLQPYQMAEQETINQGAAPVEGALNIAGFATAAPLLGSAGKNILKKVLPFLNEHIPEALALKGISKTNPKLGKFIKVAEKNGKAPKEIKQFLTDKFSEPAQAMMKTAAESKVAEKTSEIGKLFALAKKGKTQGNEFLKHASSLMKSGDIADEETFSNFYKWWQTKPSGKRGSPRAEFELFRNEIGNTLNQGQSKAALQPDQMQQATGQEQGQGQQANGDEAIMAAFQKIMQM